MRPKTRRCQDAPNRHHHEPRRKEIPAEQVAARFGITVDHVYLTKHRVIEALKEEVARLEREAT